MRFIAKILKSLFKNKSGENPFDLWGKDCWELSGLKEFPALFCALVGILPEGSVMRFEGGAPRGDLKTFFLINAVPEIDPVPKATLWPKTKVFRVPATNENLQKLSELSKPYAECDVAIHFHVYSENGVLIDWYDAFADPMYVSKRIPKDKVETLCNSLSITYKEHL
jgi:hypothetical protein